MERLGEGVIMQIDLINIMLGFLEGFALIISPCILPILPIILAGSLSGSKKNSFGIVIGFIVTFAVFTFFARSLVRATGIDLNLIRHLSFVLLIIFGVILFSEYLSEKFARSIQWFSLVGTRFSEKSSKKTDFWSGMIFGGLISLIWTPCAGPILAAVIVQTVLETNNLDSFFVILAFAIGVGVPMLLIIFFGRTLMEQMTFFKKHGEAVRKIFGLIIIASVVYMFFAEKFNVTYASAPENPYSSIVLIDGISEPYAAPQIAGIEKWINSPPLELSQLKGKVVLIDFWTYSCINCIRTLPYLKKWYDSYHKDGLVIIGVHTPEFDFEKNPDNVEKAVQNFGIKYPVALDNQFVTWRNFQNRYWPAHYLIDKEGRVVYVHFGEGNYAETENNIRFLLGMTASKLSGENEVIAPETPETYLGYARMENYASPETISYNKPASYTYPERLAENQWALKGEWNVKSQNIQSTAINASLKIHFHAQKVFIVMGSATGLSIPVKIILNDKLIKTLSVKDHILYDAVSLPESSEGVLEVISETPGLEVYTFTFG